MANVAKLGGTFEVLRDDSALGPPPNATVAALLMALLADAPDWSDRDHLAVKLLGACRSESSFRVALHRLRTWLGEDSVAAEGGKLRLSESWTVDLALVGGERAEGARIAPGFRHPLADEVRAKWSFGPNVCLDGVQTSFHKSVLAASAVDRAMGREILCSGMRIVESMHPCKVNELLAVTRPTSKDASHFPEYCELAAVTMVREGAVLEGLATYVRGSRHAMRSRNTDTGLRLGYRATFTLIEAGHFDEAEVWINSLESARRPSQFILEAANARASLAWNRNRLPEAMSMLAGARPYLSETAHYERMHFFTNYAVLASEHGEMELASELLEQGGQAAAPDLDRVFWLNRGLVTGKMLMAQGRFDEAAINLAALRSSIDEGVDLVGSVYALEWQAEAVSRSSNPPAAEALSRSVRVRRQALGLHLNPRTVVKLSRSNARI